MRSEDKGCIASLFEGIIWLIIIFYGGGIISGLLDKGIDAIFDENLSENTQQHTVQEKEEIIELLAIIDKSLDLRDYDYARIIADHISDGTIAKKAKAQILQEEWAVRSIDFLVNKFNAVWPLIEEIQDIRICEDGVVQGRKTYACVVQVQVTKHTGYFLVNDIGGNIQQEFEIICYSLREEDYIVDPKKSIHRTIQAGLCKRMNKVLKDEITYLNKDRVLSYGNSILNR